MNILEIFSNHPLIPLFLTANLAIGYWAHRKAKVGNFEDYATASGDLPTGVLIMTMLATMLSAMDLLVMDSVPPYGLVMPVTYFSMFAISALFIRFFVAPKLVFFKSHTFDGVIGELYGEKAQLLAGITHILFCLISVVIQIATIGMLSRGLFNMSFFSAVLFFGIVVVLYSTLGGMRAVSYTDVLQFVMVLIVLLWLAQKSVSEVGGIKQLFQRISEEHTVKLAFLDHPHFSMQVKAWLYYNLLSFSLVMSPPLVHRMLIVRDKSKIRRVWYTNIFIYGVIIFMISIVGFVSLLKLKGAEEGQVVKYNVLGHMIEKLFKNNPRLMDAISLGVIGILISTVDSYLHTIGIVLVKGFIEPLKKLFGHKQLGERKQLKYAKLGIALIGLLAVIIGTQVEKESARLIQRALFRPMVALQVIVMIPFILGVMGLKTDKKSFLAFGVAYLSALYGQKFLLGWSKATQHRVDYDYFLVAIPIGLLAYFMTHIYINGGIATAERGKNYMAMGLWQPEGASLGVWMKKQLKGFLNLAQQTRQAMVHRPAHPLVFSIFMFALYGLGSGIGISEDTSVPDFMAVIYLIGITLCVGLMLEGIWPFALKPYFPLYWFVTLFFCLPFGGTLTFLRVHDGLANILFVTSFALLALLVSSHAFLWMTLGGLTLAWGGWYMVMGKLPKGLWSENHIGGYIGLAILTLCVLFFSHYLEVHMARQIYLKQVFGHAVAHESRQPLTEISLLSNIQEKAMKGLTPIQNSAGEHGFFISKKSLTSMESGSEQIRAAITDIQSELIRFRKVMGEEISQIPPERVSMKGLIENIIPTLPRRRTSMVKVVIECKKDFEAMVTRAFFPNVLVNLLNNAYLHGAATEMKITIDEGERKVHIRDNGRGISNTILPSIFKFRFTTGGEVNEGIGLALVKLILDASSTKIDCISKQGEDSFTEFVLTFPSLKS
ncbi:MAG: ATP-binding protein [Bacteroidota bacterium]